MTLTCHVLHFHAPEKIKRFLWYLGRRMLRETPRNTLEVRDSGQYRCQTQDSLPSDHVSLTFSSGEKKRKEHKETTVSLETTQLPRSCLYLRDNNLYR